MIFQERKRFYSMLLQRDHFLTDFELTAKSFESNPFDQ